MIRIGTSGFSYPEWRGRFYPKALPPKGMLAHYATRLDTVELNSTFYRAPTPASLSAWAAAVPAEFRFALKAPRFLTHAVRRGNATASGAFFELASRLGEKLGPVLVQLPPWKKDLGPFRDFVRGLAPSGGGVAFEFRDASWFADDVYGVLEAHGCAMCITEGDAIDTPRVVTASFAYVRLRKDYSRSALARWARALEEMRVRDAYVYFRHKGSLKGPSYALALRKLAS